MIDFPQDANVVYVVRLAPDRGNKMEGRLHRTVTNFAVLKKHRVATIYNSWTAMPSVLEQIEMPGSITNEELCGARFLLKPGREYQEAVDLFSPYESIKDPYEEGRDAGARLIRHGLVYYPRRKTYIYVNNRFEGNAIRTIVAMLEKASKEPSFRKAAERANEGFESEKSSDS